MNVLNAMEPPVDELLFDLRANGDRGTLSLCGVLDAVNVPAIRPMLDRIVASDVQDVEIDMSRLQMIDSSGIAVIVSLFKRTRARGGTVHVIGLRDQPRAIFELLHLDRLLQAKAS